MREITAICISLFLVGCSRTQDTGPSTLDSPSLTVTVSDISGDVVETFTNATAVIPNHQRDEPGCTLVQTPAGDFHAWLMNVRILTNQNQSVPHPQSLSPGEREVRESGSLFIPADTNQYWRVMEDLKKGKQTPGTIAIPVNSTDAALKIDWDAVGAVTNDASFLTKAFTNTLTHGIVLTIGNGVGLEWDETANVITLTATPGTTNAWRVWDPYPVGWGPKLDGNTIVGFELRYLNIFETVRPPPPREIDPQDHFL